MKGPKFTPADVISVNLKYKSQNIRPSFLPRKAATKALEEHKKDVEETNKAVLVERKALIDIKIVQVMKTDRRIVY